MITHNLVLERLLEKVQRMKTDKILESQDVAESIDMTVTTSTYSYVPEFSREQVKDILRISLDVQKEQSKTYGILCTSSDCVFHSGSACGLHTVILYRGVCPHYSPNLKLSDITHYPENRQE